MLALPDIRVGGSRITFAPHNCFACGTLNAHGLQLELHAGDDVCWTELTLDRRFEGWEGIAHGGIVCTLLDEVMAWALVDHDLWGVTARMSVEFKRTVPIGRPIRAEGRVAGVRRRLVDAEGVVIEPESGLVLARADGDVLRGSRDPQAGAEGALRVPSRARGRSSRDGGRRMTAAVAERPTSTSPVTERARALVAERTPEAVALGRDSGRPRPRPGRASPRRCAPASSGSPTRSTSRASVGSPRASGRSSASASRCSPPSAAASAAPLRHDRATTLLDVADALLRERGRSSSHWLGVRPPRAHDRRGAGAHLAARPRRASAQRGRLDHHRLARARRRPRHPRRALPLGGARAARLLAVPLGAASRRLDDRDPPARRPAGRTPAGGRSARACAILADLIGDAEPDVQKALSWALRALAVVDLAGDRRVPAPRGGHGTRHRRRPPRVGGPRHPREAAGATADELRATVDGIRRRPGAPSTSRAAAAAAAFTGLGVAVPPADRPIVDRT